MEGDGISMKKAMSLRQLPISLKLFLGTAGVLSLFLVPNAHSALKSQAEVAKNKAESQVRNLLEPLLDRYCISQCKIINVLADVEYQVPDEISPGFDELDPSAFSLEPTSVRVRMLVDSMIGPVSRGKLLNLLRDHLNALEYPVTVETKITDFPKPAEYTRKMADLRDKITKEYKDTLGNLFNQFCPARCLLADYELKTTPVNLEEANYGSDGEIVQNGNVALRVDQIGGKLLLDNSLTPEERVNILEMAKLRTAYLKNAQLSPQAMRFPRPGESDDGLLAGYGRGRGLASLNAKDSKDSKEQKKLLDEKRFQRSDVNTKEDKSLKEAKEELLKNQKTESTTEANKKESLESSSKTDESLVKKERFERTEIIERVEEGSAVQEELQKFKIFGLIFAASVIALLIFIALAAFRTHKDKLDATNRILGNLTGSGSKDNSATGGNSSGDTRSALRLRYQVDLLRDELMKIFSEQPKVAKLVFTKILTEEGVEETSKYIDIFGESIVVDMIRDSSLQGELSELTEYYARNQFDLPEEEKLKLLKKLHNRTVAAKMVTIGNRSTGQFDFLVDMDGLQILELTHNESITVKAIVMTQVDNNKRSMMFKHMEQDERMKILTELSRIDYLPRDYIFNVAQALKRKRHDNPKLNTESLPGSDVLVTLLERTGATTQKEVIQKLENQNPDSARTIKNKLVSIDTLKYLTDQHLLEVILSLRHEELLQFLKGAPDSIRSVIFEKSPNDLVVELEEELSNVSNLSREAYQNVERKVLNRIKVMANEGHINLIDTNEKMFGVGSSSASQLEAS